MSEEKKLYKLFPEPVFKFKLEDYEKHNKDLLKYIYNLYEKDNVGVVRSNVNGWHSKSFNIADVNSPAHTFFKETRKFVIEVFKVQGWKYIPEKVRMTEMWAIINKKDNLNTAHTHPNNYLSAAYYVKAPKNCGNIIFYEPNDAKAIRYPEVKNYTKYSGNIVNFEPEEGKLLIFPSYIYHSVQPNKSDEDRIVISFNINLS